MAGRGELKVEVALVPRHFTLEILASLDGTAALELVQLLAEWSDDAAGGFVGAVRNALIEANGGRQLELPQPVTLGADDQPPADDDNDDDGTGGIPAVPVR